jgi:hypothetical protein
MNQDEIIEMARAAGLATTYGEYRDWVEAGPRKYRLVDFAKLVAAKEREACAKVCEKYAAANTSWTKAAVKDCAAIIKARGKQA